MPRPSRRATSAPRATTSGSRRSSRPDGTQDPRLEGEGSSAFAAGWLQNHPAGFTCDGKSHVGTFQVDNFTEYGFGQLHRGVAWVQFCVVSEATEALVLSHSEWVKVS